MVLSLAAAGIIGGLALAGTLASQANKYGTNAQEYAIKSKLAEEQFGYDTQLKEQQFGYDTQLKEQQFGYDTALSKQNAEQELAKQINQQEFDKMMSDTEMQRKVADMQQAGINPALATGGISTATGTGAAQATSTTNAPSKTNARQLEKEAKQQIFSNLANAYQTGILKEANKRISKMSEQLAKNPNNAKLKNNLKSYIFKTYHLF